MICTLGFAASDADIALFNAVKVKRLDLVNAYVHSANANARFQWAGKSMTTFQMALENEDVNIAKVLIADGNADVNAGWEDVPPIFIAIRKNLSEMVDLLASSGANLTAIFQDATPLMYCYKLSKGEPSSCADILVRKFSDNLDWGYKDKDGNTVMHLAAMGGNAGVMNFLLTEKKSRTSELLRIRNSENVTPIGIYIFNAVARNELAGGLLLNFLFTAATSTPVTISDFNLPASSMQDNGIFLVGDTNLIDESHKLIFFTTLLKGNTNKKLAAERDSFNVPLLCHAIENEWNPEIVELLIRRYGERWKTIRSSGINGKNAIETMRSNRSEDLYQNIFNAYSN